MTDSLNNASQTPDASPQAPSTEELRGYHTALGEMHLGLAEKVLGDHMKTLRGTVQMVFTSPPFALNRKKRYGNRSGDDYIEWLASFGPTLTSLLTPYGSILL
jgi:site-specific DNA-methyltransferase (cytosine-N4-specific)